MEMEAFQNPWMKKIRFLTKLLLVSGAMNIGLVTALFYVSGKSLKKEEVRSKQIVLEKSNGEVLAAYFKSSFSDLIKELKDKTILQKAISGKRVQKRKLTFFHHDGGESFQVEVFPNLDDLDFSLIEKFVKEEKWPLSAEGLFIDLKKEGREKDPALESAFFATSEFYILYTSLKRLDETLSKEKILDFLLEGSFEGLQLWIAKTKSGVNFLEGIRELFQDAVKRGSSKAAHLWINLDQEYIQRKLTDLELHHLVQALYENDLATNIFLKQVICSVRSDEVRKEAALKLYAFAKVAPPEPYDHEQALKTFLPTMFVKKDPSPATPPAYTPVVKKHLVADGDSLWKISRKYKVSIETLREHNHLKKDTLKPGQEIIIP